MKTLLLSSAVCGAFATAAAAAAPSKPNIILMTADDLGLQLSCYGDPHIKTPHLDALANSGVRFVTAYIAQASCSPSRSALLTGLYPHTNGQIGLAHRGFSMRRENTPPTLPALLRQAGYRTGIMGKLHVAPESAFGFDENLLPQEQTRDVRKVASLASDFIQQSADRPFFLYINYSDPHKELAGNSPGFPAQVKGLPEEPFKAGDIPAWPFQRVENDVILTHNANYYNCVRRVDIGVGMVMDALKASGNYDNTIIVFIGDNGPPFARAKTSCYEAGLREPLLVRWPGVSKPGVVSAAMACSTDIMPTLLEAAGVPVPKTQGRSLKSVLQGDNANWRTCMAGEYHTHTGASFFPRRAIRDNRYKLIHNMLAGRAKPGKSIDGDTAPAVSAEKRYDGSVEQSAMRRLANPPMWELYDLSADPWEFNNLADDPGHREILVRMKKELAKWQDETEDPFRDPNYLESVFAEMRKRREMPGKAVK